MPRLARLLAIASIGTIVLSIPSARADLPPPAGKKYVSYAFTVDNLTAFPDYVLLAYPASESNGAPTYEVFEVEQGKKVHLGKRSPESTLYAVKRADYEAFKAKHPAGSNDRGPSPELDAFFKGPSSMACDKAPKLVDELDTSDPRDEVVEHFAALKIDAQGCKLEETSPASATGDQTEGPTVSKKGGCAGCTVPQAGWASLAGLCGVLAAILAIAWRRRD